MPFLYFCNLIFINKRIPSLVVLVLVGLVVTVTMILDMAGIMVDLVVVVVATTLSSVAELATHLP